jgi:hypothetical protein
VACRTLPPFCPDDFPEFSVVPAHPLNLGFFEKEKMKLTTNLMRISQHANSNDRLDY